MCEVPFPPCMRSASSFEEPIPLHALPALLATPDLNRILAPLLRNASSLSLERRVSGSKVMPLVKMVLSNRNRT